MIYKGFSLGEKFDTVFKFGRNREVQTTTDPEDIWSVGGVYPFLTSSINVYVASTNTQDSAAGSGSKQIKIQGLDENYFEQEETFTLNGQTPVTGSKTFSRVHRAFITYAGSEEVNTGDINIGYGTWSSGVPSNYIAQIPANEGQTQMAVFTIPNDKRGYLLKWSSSILTGASGKAANIQLIYRENKGVNQTVRKVKDQVGLGTNSMNTFQRVYEFPDFIPPKTDVFLRVEQVTATSDITGEFSLVLVNAANTYNY